MSSVAKTVKKTFKRVTRVARNVAPLALAAGAVLVTAGAAAGVAGAAGGWGAMAGRLTTTLGLADTTLGGVLTGAVTQAGYGAAIGAGMAAITGQDIGQGALAGAGVGAVSGGAMGGLGFATDPLGGNSGGGGGQSVTGATDAAIAPGSAAGGVTGMPADPTWSGGAGVMPTGSPAGPAAAGPQIAASSTPAAQSGGFFGPGGWLERNQDLAGHVVSGAGKGILAGMTAGDDADALQERQRQIADNYRGGGVGLLTQQQTRPYDASGNPRPADLYGSRTSTPPSPGTRFAYNPQTNRIERIQTA